MYFITTVNTTGLFISDTGANTWVLSTWPEEDAIVGIFQLEGPKILTKLFCGVNETARSVIEFCPVSEAGNGTALSLFIAKVTF
jgi:hypothetical protein